MDKNQSSKIQNNENESAVGTDGRRKFLQKASAGALIATIPAKSVWATGLTNSITASGHGSDFAGGRMNLQDVHFWSRQERLMGNTRFEDVFGGPAIEGYNQFFNANLKLSQVMTHMTHGVHVYAGPNHINRQLVATYLNALYHESFGIFFPVVGAHPKPYDSAESLARALYLNATGTGGGARQLASELESLNSTKASSV